ncbi:MAG: PulJ/GspJ family protein, partial [Planctomycetota bacterium]
MSRGERAFTLLEVLVAMGLFTVVGFAVVLLMRAGVDIWLRGNRNAQQEDRLEQSLPRLQEDLRHVVVPIQRDRIPFDPKDPDPEKEPDPLPPDIRFLSGQHPLDVGGRQVPCRYLAFTRRVTGLPEVEVYDGRAGSNPKADAYIDGKDDEDEFRRNVHLPTSGAVEVLWIWLPDETRPGVGGVYRAYRSPVGGKDTLLDPKNYDTAAKVVNVIRPLPVFQEVVHFDLLFWTQYTTRWEYSEG